MIPPIGVSACQADLEPLLKNGTIIQVVLHLPQNDCLTIDFCDLC